jgi:hypothetical protein
MILLSLPFLMVAPVSAQAFGLVPALAQSQHKAVILSSLEGLAPMGFYGKLMNADLKQAGYNVTDLDGAAVTVDFMVTQLNNYDVIIWRTNTYIHSHTTYWYVGERVNSAAQQKYATDFANGWIDLHAGTLGVNLNFFSNHFPTGSLSNVKLILLISSDSSSIGLLLMNAKARAVVICMAQIDLSFGLIDDLTGQLVSYLTHGDNLLDSVTKTVAPFGNQPRDYLDSTYSPPFWFLGDGTLTLA